MRKYFLVWLSSLGEVEELSLNEFREFVYEDYYDGCKKMYEDVEKNDVGNGLMSYVGYDGSWIIIEDLFVDQERI